VAVTVTLNVPRGEEIVRAEVADVTIGDNIRLVGFRVIVALPDGAFSVRLTVPENPLYPSRVIVDIPEVAALIVRDAGLADTLKLGGGTVTATLVDREVDELLAIT
jgi:hypothetical protein